MPLRPIVLAISLVILPIAAAAHHNFNATYDGERIIELEGEVTDVFWRNPHVEYRLRTESGQEWEVETAAVSVITRMEIPRETIEAGDQVRFAGNPARGDEARMFARHALLGDRREIVFQPHLTPRWTSNIVGTFENWRAEKGDGSRPDLGIFRVWSSRFAPDSTPLYPEIRNPALARKYPLTASARDALEQFDAATGRVAKFCELQSMPKIMESPLPMQFTDEGDRILLRMEGYDSPRTIHMNQEPAGEKVTPTPIGHSVGRWDGDTLVVTTTRISSGNFNSIGIPLSTKATIVERFTPSEDGSRLNYRMRVTDPETFTEPVVLEKHWIWLPDAEIRDFECVS